jgi:hypothetical protein
MLELLLEGLFLVLLLEVGLLVERSMLQSLFELLCTRICCGSSCWKNCCRKEIIWLEGLPLEALFLYLSLEESSLQWLHLVALRVVLRTLADRRTGLQPVRLFNHYDSRNDYDVSHTS